MPVNSFACEVRLGYLVILVIACGTRGCALRHVLQ